MDVGLVLDPLERHFLDHLGLAVLQVIIELILEEAADLVRPVGCFITISAEYCASVSLVIVPPCMSAPITWCAQYWCAVSWATT